ncbi:putative membrane protein [Escherichia coli p0305293.2]|nr:putative membrane protein [Escherichia coli p0305293.2]
MLLWLTITIAMLHVGGLTLPLIVNVAVSEENAGEANP